MKNIDYDITTKTKAELILAIEKLGITEIVLKQIEVNNMRKRKVIRVQHD